ncbi:hypothetical protein Aple_097360 [Acrocarpospora pleiomorpha]|uniref:Uncharacterized protein n=1 Tax=Acrocarpospora pleiomorpha TaxID=90975 RepID=A0A5M3Y0H4_9ACTN|nr:hypothetical protein Aple_097360 [Acrocarpospora pleiomorpha]
MIRRLGRALALGREVPAVGRVNGRTILFGGRRHDRARVPRTPDVIGMPRRSRVPGLPRMANLPGLPGTAGAPSLPG